MRLSPETSARSEADFGMENVKSRPLSRVSGSPICVPSGSSPFRMRSNVAVSTVPDSPRSFAPARKSDVEGQGVSVLGELGGCRFLKKKIPFKSVKSYKHVTKTKH